MKGTFNKYLWTKKIDVSAWCDGDPHFITLREPNTAEFKNLCKLQSLLKEDETGELVMEALETFCTLTTTLIVDHDFYDLEDNTKKLAAKDVAEFISSKLDLAESIMVDYCQNLPLLKGNKTK